MLRHGGSQPRNQEGASYLARRGKNAEAFLISVLLFRNVSAFLNSVWQLL